MKRILWLAVLMVLPGLTSAQAVPASQADTSLSLQVVPEGLDKGFPLSFAFMLTNRTDHELHVPEPSVECGNSYSGSIWLRMHFVPLNPGDGLGHGCAADRYQWPPILERAQAWRVLRPGESITVRNDLHYLNMDSFRPGTYDLWAEYAPPSISADDAQRLETAGIRIARATAPSNHLSYVKQP